LTFGKIPILKNVDSKLALEMECDVSEKVICLLYITDEEFHLFCFKIFEWDRSCLCLGSKICAGNIICLYKI